MHACTRFGLLNYRALESVLTQYPDARVRVLLVAPERANYYKYGNALPATQFEKYQKRGYDVALQLVGERELAELKQGVPGMYERRIYLFSSAWPNLDAGEVTMSCKHRTYFTYMVVRMSESTPQPTDPRGGLLRTGFLGAAREDGFRRACLPPHRKRHPGYVDFL